MMTTTERFSYLNVVTTRLQVKVQKGEGDVMRGGDRDDGHTPEVVGVNKRKVGRVDDPALCCEVTVTHCMKRNMKHKHSDRLSTLGASSRHNCL